MGSIVLQEQALNCRRGRSRQEDRRNVL